MAKHTRGYILRRRPGYSWLAWKLQFSRSDYVLNEARDTLFPFLIRSSAGFNRVTVARFGTPEIAIIDSKSFPFFHRDKSDIIVLFAVNIQLKRQNRASSLELYDISLLLLLFMFNCSSGEYLLLLNFYERNSRWKNFFRRSSSVKFH